MTELDDLPQRLRDRAKHLREYEAKTMTADLLDEAARRIEELTPAPSPHS